MEKHKKILKDLSEKNFPRQIDSENFSEIEIFKELYEQGLVAAIDASSLDGDCYIEIRITMAGRQFLADEENLMSKDLQSFNIGSITGGVIQLGNSNSTQISISLQEVVAAISKSNDEDAKSKLKDFLNNATVANIIGAGVQGLVSIL